MGVLKLPIDEFWKCTPRNYNAALENHYMFFRPDIIDFDEMEKRDRKEYMEEIFTPEKQKQLLKMLDEA